MKHNINHRGFTLIEVLIVIAVAVVILPGIIALQSLSSFSSGQGEKYVKAYALAESEMEKIYKEKESWDWTAPTYTPPLTDGFTETVDIANVERCGSQICPDGTPGIVDDYTKKISLNISWNERGKAQEINLISYVTKN